MSRVKRRTVSGVKLVAGIVPSRWYFTVCGIGFMVEKARHSSGESGWRLTPSPYGHYTIAIAPTLKQAVNHALANWGAA